MKKPVAWPRQIIEVSARRSDRRADPHATARIPRADLDAALARTKSGMQRVARPTPLVGTPSEDAFPGPRDDDFSGVQIAEPLAVRDDGPEITIRSIDSVVDLEPVGRLTPLTGLDRESSLSAVTAPIASPAPRKRSNVLLAVVLLAIAAALVLSFFAGRLSVL